MQQQEGSVSLKKGGHQDLPTNHDQLALHPIELGTAGDCLTRVIRVGGCVVCPTNVGSSCNSHGFSMLSTWAIFANS